MSENKNLSFGDIKEKVKEHLKTALGIEEFSITFAKLEKEVWKINVEFKEGDWDRTALFKIDAITGEVLEFRKDYYWRF
ncbi:MAG: hypothetical protein ACXQS7_00005 [Candidatus Syntropharchaeia archaeon]